MLTLYGNPIPVVNETKFLGVVFDKKLSFKPHIHSLKMKCKKALNILKVVGKTDWGADRQTLLRLYQCFVRSKLDYGCMVYGSARQSYLKSLEPIMNEGIRICLGAYRTSPRDSVLVEANELPLHLRVKNLSARYAFHAICNRSNPVREDIVNPKFEDLFGGNPNVIAPFSIRVKATMQSIDFDTDALSRLRLPKLPPWELHRPVVDFSLHVAAKHITAPQVYVSLFHELVSKQRNTILIFTDGSKHESRVAAAMVSPIIATNTRLPDNSSIYSAELHGLIMALREVLNSRSQRFMICSDSLSGLQSISNLELRNPLVLKVLEVHHRVVERGKSVRFCWVPGHVGIQGNEDADTVAKAGLNEPLGDVRVPYTDVTPIVNRSVRRVWQTNWNDQVGNKLREVKPILGESKSVHRRNRREETILSRLRLGHTYLTHSYLLKSENPQFAINVIVNSLFSMF